LLYLHIVDHDNTAYLSATRENIRIDCSTPIHTCMRTKLVWR